ncbi:hypothetical protein [Streptomyces iconiensis]|uniref:Uncharacterized protein n=1 Tax=Streptomyces iconiensis TaxID=1384038 RepID=A0ABT6ZWV9_9ACTN|nr:hypothetical protein [Streptomyces iconiensis]MDJ1133561.1 hypothetical protein [Streptomyces iconiensis]
MGQHGQADDQAQECGDCAWFCTQIDRAMGYPQPRADLEALYGAHLRHEHAPEERGV